MTRHLGEKPVTRSRRRTRRLAYFLICRFDPCRVSTSELSISYLTPAPSSDLVGVGKVFSEGKKLIRVDVEVYAPEDGGDLEGADPIAAGRGCFYKRLRNEGSKEAEEEGRMFVGYLGQIRAANESK